MTLENAVAAPAEQPAGTPADQGNSETPEFTSPDAAEKASSDDTESLVQPQEGDETETPPETQPQDDPWADYEEVEWEGKTYKIPSEVKGALLRQADYTRKTQEVAEARKQVEALAQEVRLAKQRTDDEINTIAELKFLSNQLEPVKDFNWAAAHQQLLTDPNLASDPLAQQEAINKLNAAYLHWQQTQQKASALQQKLHEFERARAAAEQQETAKRLAATRAYAEKEIKGWTPALDDKITEFAVKTLGFDLDTLKAAYNPQNYRTLYLAYLGHQSQIRQSTARPSPNSAPPAATQTVTAKANPSVVLDPEKMTPDEYVAARRAGKIK